MTEKIFLVKTKDLGRPLLFTSRKVELTKEEIELLKNLIKNSIGMDYKDKKYINLIKKLEAI